MASEVVPARLRFEVRGAARGEGRELWQAHARWPGSLRLDFHPSLAIKTVIDGLPSRRL
jgi:hypothetical protein